ncbi:activating signal cointegrator 1 complex subunit 3 [Tieghemiomyces parasiticus]|uniref:Activating signal cointegrator 1 complex subunit 3 n=1 Tax=Tieghemiomyces parasiticus TaxID=78921 RepID=A0A9W8DX75_9FUNG|nr:activating signal cointegrator 1 complex subunit 3 [Tieghemiomyces parasiticus]
MDHGSQLAAGTDPLLALCLPPPDLLVSGAFLQQSTVSTSAPVGLPPLTEIRPEGHQLRQARVQALRRARQDRPLRPQTRTATDEYPHVYNSRQAGNTLSMFGQRYALPVGTEREDYHDYEEITIPVTTQAPIRTTEAPVLIENLDPLCRRTFKSYRSLNRIQSIIYPTAYQSNENMLVCAPTGAGKTDVAMLTILRTIALFCRPRPWEVTTASNLDRPPFAVDRDDFKIIYVAPMKALAAEVTRKIASRVKWLGLNVRELTGDMQLTRAEVRATQILVTTPEKWDVVTRKGTGDTDLVSKVRLLIIDEVHLLHEDRGAVLESLVARTLRQVETSQALIRIVGLSATLPNYVDVAHFLRVNPYVGLFYFDASFRPVPLEQHFIGVKGKPNSFASLQGLNRRCYATCADLVARGHQVMVFVHARRETAKTAQYLRLRAAEEVTSDDFAGDPAVLAPFLSRLARSRQRELQDLVPAGFAIHHAGMTRPDRTLAEELFAAGAVRVLCCTSTLAWGVNLPAYAVCLKGTSVYSADQGKFVDLSVLDVLQIFGRAGRPQYESEGVGYILTTHDRLAHYVSAITQQHPIESCFPRHLADNLNAEVALGTVATLTDAAAWLGYTFFHVRLTRNPLAYGLTPSAVEDDPGLARHRRDLLAVAARLLHTLKMVRYDATSERLEATALGRLASAYYLGHTTVATASEGLRPRFSEADGLALLSRCGEFSQITVRESERIELEQLLHNDCYCAVPGGLDTGAGKVNVLLQATINRSHVTDPSLIADLAYVRQNSGRVVRALFELALDRRWGAAARVLLTLTLCLEHQLWPFEPPLVQMDRAMPPALAQRLERLPHDPVVLRTVDPTELGDRLLRGVREFPHITLTTTLAPLAHTVLRLRATLAVDFQWSDRLHGAGEPWWVLVEGETADAPIYHAERVWLRRKLATLTVEVLLPVPDPLPDTLAVRVVSDRWLGATTVASVQMTDITLPAAPPPATPLLPLDPVPVRAVTGSATTLQSVSPGILYFNPIQTQLLHALYQARDPLVVAAPAGTGRATLLTLAVLGQRHRGPTLILGTPVVSWIDRLARNWLATTTKVTIAELASTESADVYVTTPARYARLLRRSFLGDDHSVVSDTLPPTPFTQVLVAGIDRLLGDHRQGPALEAVIQHLRSAEGSGVRRVALAVAQLAAPADVAAWWGLPADRAPHLYNFSDAVRPHPVTIDVEGFPEPHYQARLAAMQRPVYLALRGFLAEEATLEVGGGALVVVPSRRQLHLTARDLIAHGSQEENPRPFLGPGGTDAAVTRVRDSALRHALGFGLGLDHAGLPETDRRLVRRLFRTGAVRVLLTTAPSQPAPLVVVVGTEIFDGRTQTYVDRPPSELRRTVEQATRRALLLVQDAKRAFYARFLREPWPVESALEESLGDYLNAGLAVGAINTRREAVGYLGGTFYYRRLLTNPTYYEVKQANQGLSRRVDASFAALAAAGCLAEPKPEEGADLADRPVTVTPLGRLAAKHTLAPETAAAFQAAVAHSVSVAPGSPSAPFRPLLIALAGSVVYASLPVRLRDDDPAGRALLRQVPLTGPYPPTSPHARALFLLQARLERLSLPDPDDLADLRTVLEPAGRLAEALVAVAALCGTLASLLHSLMLTQGLARGLWPYQSPLRVVPGITTVPETLILPELMVLSETELTSTLQSVLALDRATTAAAVAYVRGSPIVDIHLDPYRAAHTRQLELHVRLTRHPTAADSPVAADSEAWWVVLGQATEDRVLAARRVQFAVLPHQATEATITLAVPIDAPVGATLYLMSETHLGLDQERPVSWADSTERS